ncbi:hypothetical protein ACQEVF_58190 [Nonomuraea polychroma]|uniref:hypothetical protein n=1 Tax=Nonomuraea polychroma TaxID=46176 RepID=UPI003D94E1E1
MPQAYMGDRFARTIRFPDPLYPVLGSIAPNAGHTTVQDYVVWLLVERHREDIAAEIRRRRNMPPDAPVNVDKELRLHLRPRRNVDQLPLATADVPAVQMMPPPAKTGERLARTIRFPDPLFPVLESVAADAGHSKAQDYVISLLVSHHRKQIAAVIKHRRQLAPNADVDVDAELQLPRAHKQPADQESQQLPLSA